MLQDLSERLASAAEEMARLARTERRVDTLRTELREANQAASGLKYQLAKEENDVAALESPSLTNLFVSLFGDKDEKLFKERQEAVAAQLKYDEAVHRAESLAEDLRRAEQEMTSLSGARARYESLLAEKAAAIQGSGSPRASELFRFTERQQQLTTQERELGEAINAGISAAGALGQVEEALRSAAGYGTWDMLGGGMIATALKHSRLDDAKSAAYRASQALQGFRRELQDVQLDISPESVGLDGFSRFADYFFDGLLTDWVIQSRINDSLDRARSQRLRVENLVDNLARRQGALQAERDQIARERTAFIEQYRP